MLFTVFITRIFTIKISELTRSKSKAKLKRSKSRARQFDFDRPEKELFIMCLLLNRIELAKIFWRMGQDHVGKMEIWMTFFITKNCQAINTKIAFMKSATAFFDYFRLRLHRNDIENFSPLTPNFLVLNMEDNGVLRTLVNYFKKCNTPSLSLLCHLRSIAAHRDHFVPRLSVRPIVCLYVCLSRGHTFLVVTHSYVLQATDAFLGMLPLCLDLKVVLVTMLIEWKWAKSTYIKECLS